MVALQTLRLLIAYLSIVELVFARGKIIDVFNGGRGDIVELQEKKKLRYNSGSSKFRNAILSNSRKKWNSEDSYGNIIIPFKITGLYVRDELRVIEKAMVRIQTNTCIRFQKRTYESDYVEIQNVRGEGCYTTVGRSPGRNILMLEANEESTCIEVRIVQHELLHVIGLWHEHMRYDRDNYIKVYYKNIRPGYEDQFDKISSRESTVYNMPYDYTSLMHYKKTAFGFAGRITMRTLDPSYMDVIGNQKDASRSDYQKVCNIYRCTYCNGGSINPGKPPPPTTKPVPTTYGKCVDTISRLCATMFYMDMLDCHNNFGKRYCCATCKFLAQEQENYPFGPSYIYYDDGF